MESGEGDLICAGTQDGERVFDGGLVEDGFQTFANCGEDHLELRCRGRCRRQIANFFEDGGGGVGRDYRDGDDAASGGFYFFAADDLIVGPVASFDEDVGEEGGDDFAGSGFVEDDDGVDAFESG